MKIKTGVTDRNFNIVNFKDYYGAKCSIQKSSLATKNCIWFGVDDADPKIMASQTQKGGTGWVKFHIPNGVSLNTRMHLTQQQIKELLPFLQHFAKTGYLP